MAYCIGSSSAGMSLPSRWIRYGARSPAGGVSEMLASCGTPISAASARLAKMKRHSGSCAIAIGIGARSMIAWSERRRWRSSSGLRLSRTSKGPHSAMDAASSHHSGAARSGHVHAAAPIGRYCATNGRFASIEVRLLRRPPTFLSSSMVEHPAVNRRVAGSNPA